MQYEFAKLVDIPRLQTLMESLYLATEIPCGIIDVKGNILVKVGWTQICSGYYRQHSQTALHCRESDNYIKHHLHDTGTYIWYKCLNGLVDAAAPILIDGTHVATVFYGQFLHEEAEDKLFRNQARVCGFNEAEFMAAVAQIPVCSKERMDSIMKFYIQLASMLGDLGMARLKQLEMQTKQLEENDHQLLRIFNSTPNVAIQSYDKNGNITFWNDASENFYGYKADAVINKCVSQVYDEKTADKLIEMIKEIEITDTPQGPGEWDITGKDGCIKTVYATLFPVILSRGREYICMDVTEQKKLEKELSRLDRLNMVGEIAASIGHEVRNPMTTVRGYLQMLRNNDCFKAHRNQFDLMIEELDRANDIIKEFLTLARNKPVDKRVQKLNQIIAQMHPLMCADAVKDNKAVNIILNEIADLHLDEKEIRQLLLNLVRNGLEAMESGGRLSIETYQDKNEVVMRVRDSGSGISKEILDKIGMPFFTTKPQGTGLGLATCYSIASRHQARININSDASGTAVCVRFQVPEVKSKQELKAVAQ